MVWAKLCRWMVVLCMGIPLSTAWAEVDDLERAQTLHRLALGMDVDSEVLRAAADAYQQVLQDPSVSDARRVAAQAGLDQTTARLENADEMFRNVWPRVWMLHGDQGVYEWYDASVELALDRAWSGLQGQIFLTNHPVMPLISRCAGDAETCAVLRDMVFLAGQDAARLQPLSDDHLQILGSMPIDLGVVGFPPPNVAALTSAISEPDVVLLDVSIHPDVLWKGDRVSRVSLHAQRLHETGEISSLAHGQGVGVDVTNRWASRHIFALIMMLAAATAGVVVRLTPRRFSSAVMGMVFFGSGAVLLIVSLDLTVQWFPEMDALAWDPNGNPLLSSAAWPLLQAAVVTLGPLVATVGLWQTLHRRLGSLFDVDRLNWQHTPMLLQWGALFWFVGDLPTLFGMDGWRDAVAMVLGVGLPMTVAGPALWGAMRTATGRTQRLRQLSISVLVSAAAFVLFSLGVADVWLMGLGVVGLLLALAVVIGIGHDVDRSMQAPVAAEVEIGDVQHLKNTVFVERSAQPVSAEVTWLVETAKVHKMATLVVTGSSGMGKTRWCQQIITELTMQLNAASVQGKKKRRRDALYNSSQGSRADGYGAAAYQILADLLEDVLPVLERVESYDASQQLLDLTGDFDPLEMVPGVALLTGLIEPQDTNVQSSDRIRADVTRTLRGILSVRPVIWFVDDLQDADEESIDILFGLREALQQGALPHSMYLLISKTHERGQVEDRALHDLQQEDPRRIRWVRLSDMHAKEVGQLVTAAGLQDPDEHQVQWLTIFSSAPGEVLSVLNHMAAHGSLVEKDTQQALPSHAVLNTLQPFIPTDLLERELQRLAAWEARDVLTSPDLLLLECAAQCGQTFNTRTLAAGLHRDHFEILDKLSHFERELGIIADIDTDDCFAFELKTTWKAFQERVLRRHPHKKILPEVLRAFHEEAAAFLCQQVVERGERIPADVIHHHFSRAGERHHGKALQWAVRAAEEARDVFAWNRAMLWVERSMGPLVPEWRDRRRYVQALSLRAQGDADSLNRAREELHALLHSPHVDIRRVLLDWLETMYLGFVPVNLQNLVAWSEEPRDWSRPWMAETVSFYRCLAIDRLGPPHSDAARRTCLRDLADILTRLKSTDAESETDRRYREMLCARIETESGNKWNIVRDRTAVESVQMHDLLRASLSRKEALGDREGMATCYGILGGIALYTERDPVAARAWFEKDLAVLQETGSQTFIPKLLNQLGQSDYLRFEQGGANDAEMLSQSMAQSLMSLEQAISLQRTWDAVFALRQLLHVAQEQSIEVAALAHVFALGEQLHLSEPMRDVFTTLIAQWPDSPRKECVQQMLDGAHHSQRG